MRPLFLTGLGFTAFSVVQLLSFIGAAYPSTKLGITLILLLIFLLIIAGGINDAVRLYLEGYNSLSRDSLMVAFAPACIVGVVFLIATMSGIYAAIQ